MYLFPTYEEILQKSMRLFFFMFFSV